MNVPAVDTASGGASLSPSIRFRLRAAELLAVLREEGTPAESVLVGKAIDTLRAIGESKPRAAAREALVELRTALDESTKRVRSASLDAVDVFARDSEICDFSLADLVAPFVEAAEVGSISRDEVVALAERLSGASTTDLRRLLTPRPGDVLAVRRGGSAPFYATVRARAADGTLSVVFADGTETRLGTNPTIGATFYVRLPDVHIGVSTIEIASRPKAANPTGVDLSRYAVGQVVFAVFLGGKPVEAYVVERKAKDRASSLGGGYRAGRKAADGSFEVRR